MSAAPNKNVWSDRRARLSKLLAGKTALIANGGIRYRNTTAVELPFRGSSHCIFLAGRLPPGAMVLITPERTTLILEALSPDHALWNGEVPDREGLKVATGVDAIADLAVLEREIKKIGANSIVALQIEDLAANQQMERLLDRAIDREGADKQLIDAIVSLRLQLDEFGIQEMRSAVPVTARAHEKAREAAREGVTEREICAAIQREFFVAGCEVAYQPICSVHGEVLHNHSYQNTLRAGDLLLVDAGAESVGGYATDVTRAYPASRKFSKTQRAVYELVLETEKATIEKVEPGARYRDIHLFACRRLTAGLVDLGLLRGEVDSLVERGAHALFFPHGVGHLIGLDVQDMRDLGDAAWYGPGRKRSTQFGLSYLRLDRELAPGMCVTIEPGIYFVPSILNNAALVGPLKDAVVFDGVKKFSDVRGIRIEDDILVTKTGRENLTAVIPKELSALE